MAKKGKSSKADDPTTAKREQPLQAVLLADSFLNTFRPLSLDRPKVLCPLNNVAMIDYTMDFLASAGVEELIVVCVSDQVEEYVKGQSANKSSMEVTIVKDRFFGSAGDALRELDKRNIVQSDPFILMFGDVVTNVDLTDAIANHLKRHKADSRNIMTILLKRIGAAPIVSSNSSHYDSIRPCTDDLVVGMDPTHENRILFYHNEPDRKNAALPCSFFTTNPEIELHDDLLDCGIHICSPDVLARFSDNFDYGDIRKEFVTNSVAEEEEGLQNRIFGHIVRNTEYAARIQDFSSYATVSRDLLRRWCYPVVPENMLSHQQTRYTLQRHYVYREVLNGRTRCGRSSSISGPGMIGTSCLIGEDCVVQACVLGNYCHISDRAVLKDSHLWDSVMVEEGATVVQAVLADGACVKKGAVVSRGCVVGSGCVVGENVVLPPFTRLTLKEEEQDDFGDDWNDSSGSEEGSDKSAEMEEAQIVSDTDVVGKDGKGMLWMPPREDDDDSDEEEEDNLVQVSIEEQIRSQSIGYDRSFWYEKRYAMQSEADDDYSDVAMEDFPAADDDRYNDAVDFTTSVAGTSAQAIVGRQKGVDVIAEMKQFCLEYELTSPIENLAIELNSFKFSQNATYSDCTIAATMAILQRMNITKGVSDGKLVAEFKAALEHWAPLLQKMSIGIEEEKAIVLGLERCAIEGGEMGEVLSSGMTFRFFLQTLHDEEVVSEEAILAWSAERTAEGDTARVRLYRLKPVQEFLEWLAEDSEEESDDDDDDESD